MTCESFYLLPEVCWCPSPFPQLLGCLMYSQRALTSEKESLIFLDKSTVSMFVAICNKGPLEMNCGSKPRLALFTETFDVRGDKSFKGEHVLSIVERKKKMMLHNKNEPNINSISVPSLRVHLSLYVFCIPGFSIS